MVLHHLQHYKKNSSSVTLFTVSSFVPSWTCALIVLLSNFFTSSSVQTRILDKTSVFIITTFRLIRIVNVMLEVVYRVPIVIDNGQEKSHKKLTFSIKHRYESNLYSNYRLTDRDGILTAHFL